MTGLDHPGECTALVQRRIEHPYTTTTTRQGKVAEAEAVARTRTPWVNLAPPWKRKKFNDYSRSYPGPADAAPAVGCWRTQRSGGEWK
jgi:hypothetical protein